VSTPAQTDRPLKSCRMCGCESRYDPCIRVSPTGGEIDRCRRILPDLCSACADGVWIHPLQGKAMREFLVGHQGATKIELLERKNKQLEQRLRGARSAKAGAR
jgi:hypothetical protein